MGGTSEAGGMGGMSQTGGMGGGQMAMAKAECASDQDCKLINNCCDCMGLPSNSPAPLCNQKLCKATTCAIQKLPLPLVAQCEVGRCVAGFNCKWADVLCKSVQPICPVGETNSVVGTCWGPCVPATQCEFISTCKQCSPTQVCVTKQAKIGGGRHCVDLPGECNSSATCGCMGASVCLKPFDTCAAKANELVCSCPNC